MTIRARRLSRPAMLVATLPALLGAMLWAAVVVNDANRVPAELAASARETGVMFCTEGAVDRDESSLWGRIVSGGTFRCTSWHLRGKSSSTTTGAVGWPSSPRR